MLEEVNHELYSLCENAATGIIDRITAVLSGTFAKLPVPESWTAKGFNYLDYIAYRVGTSPLAQMGSVQDQAREGVRLEVNKLSEAERFALAAFFIENREKTAEEDDDPSPEANQVQNPVPSDDEIIDFVLDCWGDELYDRYEDVSPNVTEADAVTVVEGRKPINCPYCGGRIVPIIYGEPSEEVFEKYSKGEVMLGGCCITGDDPEWECNKCGQRFRRK